MAAAAPSSCESARSASAGSATVARAASFVSSGTLRPRATCRTVVFMLIRGKLTLLRAARDEDVPEIVALFDSEPAAAAHGPRFPHTQAAVRAEIDRPDDSCLAIETNGQFLGYLRLSRSWSDEVMTIQELLLGAEYIGKGYALDALGALLEHFFARWGGRRVELAVRADNQRAIRLYQRLGFQVEGRRREVIPPNWGPPESRDYLWMGLLSGEFVHPT